MDANLLAVKALLPDNRQVRDDFDLLFNEESLKEIIESPADELELVIKSVYDVFPILAERYHYSYLLEKVSIYEGSFDMSLTGQEQRDHFDQVVLDTIDELEKLTSNYDLVVTNYHIRNLRDQNISRTNKKKILCRLENAARGKSVLTKKYVNMFPDWVNRVEDIFDYSVMANNYGYRLVGNSNVTICAYCGLEKIQTYNNRHLQVRPDLDHFYPKSRFPFLAISLFNLVPSGHICNQKNKKNSSMLGYVHPCLDSVQQRDFFQFSFSDTADVVTTLKVDVESINEIKDKNISLFKIKHLYNGDSELRNWYAVLYALREFHKSNGDNLATIDFTALNWRHTIRLDAPSTEVSAQQFKIDAINDLFGSSLNVVEQ
ncbi:hypothetical protein [Vibrio campbellii]|uniref:hypothetical protein n=1 Tax=Vibrio campbellii TaxID=680 RepID=UPI0013154855|nr:hypothetical protein [Vibrio campbellii]